MWAATEARALGLGGIALVARATGISTSTITRGLTELQARVRVPPGWVRRPGGGCSVAASARATGCLKALMQMNV